MDPDPAAITATVDLIMSAKRPILYTGGGIINAGPEGQRRAARPGRHDGRPPLRRR